MIALPMHEDIRLQVHGATAAITVGRPQKLNAMRLQSWRALAVQVAAADADPDIGLIVVRGSGDNFGAGNDIAELSTFPGHPAAALAFARAEAEATRAVERTSKPVIMAIEGICFGAALALALAGDLRVASAGAVFSIPAARLGALYLRSDLHRLVAAVGAGQARSLLYSGQTIGAARAERIGLIDDVLSADRFDEELDRLVAGIQAGSPFTLRRTKAMLRELGHGNAPADTDESLASFVEATQSPDFGEGVSAFLVRRPPCFVGAAAGEAVAAAVASRPAPE